MTQNISPLTDAEVVDRIATLLGTSPEWDSGYLEEIADQIGKVRPHPGDSADTYVDDFRTATGRECPAAFVQDQEI